MQLLLLLLVLMGEDQGIKQAWRNQNIGGFPDIAEHKPKCEENAEFRRRAAFLRAIFGLVNGPSV
jgi:hypothetical protein